MSKLLHKPTSEAAGQRDEPKTRSKAGPFDCTAARTCGAPEAEPLAIGVLDRVNAQIARVGDYIPEGSPYPTSELLAIAGTGESAKAIVVARVREVLIEEGTSASSLTEARLGTNDALHPCADRVISFLDILVMLDPHPTDALLAILIESPNTSVRVHAAEELHGVSMHNPSEITDAYCVQLRAELVKTDKRLGDGLEEIKVNGISRQELHAQKAALLHRQPVDWGKLVAVPGEPEPVYQKTPSARCEADRSILEALEAKIKQHETKHRELEDERKLLLALKRRLERTLELAKPSTSSDPA